MTKTLELLEAKLKSKIKKDVLKIVELVNKAKKIWEFRT